MRQARLSAAITALLTFTNGCAKPPETPSVMLNGKHYTVELADTPELRERGLMFRQEMPENAGMLFIHDDEEPVAYWMKNTYIPLDILYFDSRLRLVSAQLGAPPCGNQPQCPIFPSAGPVRYVLELNAGQAVQIHLKPGDLLTLEGIPRGH